VHPRQAAESPDVEQALSEPNFSRPRAALLQRTLLRSVVPVYRGPVADFLQTRCVMVLTTIGRRSGLPRATAVSFMPLDGRFVVFSGWGVNSNWYRNVRANPEVLVRVGRRRLRGTARLVEDPERRAALMRAMAQRSGGCGPPGLVRPFVRLLFDYEAEIRMALAQGAALPVVEITPRDEG
jgi:deazaflavin-dependent oxidoreductase (nitroreductase family)